MAHVSDARNVEFPLVHVHAGQNVARSKEATFAHHQRLGQGHLKGQRLKATSTSTVFDPFADICRGFQKKKTRKALGMPSSILDLSWPWSIQSQPR